MDKIWQRNDDGSYTVFEAGEGPEIRAAKSRRAALLEEVVNELERLQITQEHGAILRGAGKLGMEIESDKYTNLIARVRAEWGEG